MNGFEVILPFLKPIEHLILDESISEVMVNGADCIFIEKRGFLEHVKGVSLSERALLVAVKNIARRLGDDIPESKPILDSRLPDGSRVAAVIPPCSLGGLPDHPQIQFRHFEIEDLIQTGSLDRPLANKLEDYVLKRNNILISGGTGTGKSTLAGLLAKFIPEDERILLIEDTAELNLAQRNLVRFEARREQNGFPGVAIRDLLKASLRHRPDRIILGEIRSAEAFDLLQRLNTGHAGTLSTIHASSAKQGLARFASCVLESGVELPYKAIKTNIGDSLEVLVHLERRPGKRFISQVLELNGYDPDADAFHHPSFSRRSPNRENSRAVCEDPLPVGVHPRIARARGSRRSASLESGPRPDAPAHCQRRDPRCAGLSAMASRPEWLGL
jgi:pilus assembly protein CpaF